METLVLYGAGKRCRTLCALLNKTTDWNVHIVDSNPLITGNIIEGYQIEGTDALKSYDSATFCITVLDKNECKKIKKFLYEYFNSDYMDISYDELLWQLVNDNIVLNKSVNQNIRKQKEIVYLYDCYNGLGLGGVEAWTKNVCEELLADNVTTYIISDRGNYDVPKVLENNILWTDIDHNIRFNPTSIINIVNQIISHIPCCVVTSTVNEVMVAAYLVKKVYPSEIYVISVIHNSNEDIYNQYLTFRACTDIYVSVSKDIQAEMIARGIEKESVLTMTCPFVCEENLARVYTEDSTQSLHIGYAGRLDGMEHSQKRMDLLLKLVAELVERNVMFQMQIAGEGTAREEMEKFVVQNGLGKYVQFLGRLERTEIPVFWRKQDIGVNLSDFEGRSISQLEAMANGVVLVVTETSGVKEDITNGENGYYVPLGDYKAIADKIEYLSLHRERLRSMGERAHAVVYPKSLMEAHITFWKNLLIESTL